MKDPVTRSLLVQKITSFILTTALFLFINNTYDFMLAAIVLGHSHFLIAYFYKLMSGKVKIKNFLVFVGLAAFLFAFFYRIDFPDYRIESLLLLATVYAIYHTILDDQFTFNFFKPVYSALQKLQMLFLIFALIGLHVSWQFNSPYAVFFVLAGILAVCKYFLIVSKEKYVLKASDCFFLAQGALAVVLFFMDIRFNFGKMLMISFIGVYHYLIYYFHYYSKIISLPKGVSALNTKPVYLAVVFLSNGLMIGLFLYMISTKNTALSYFFSYNLFLVLTLMHFISSTRVNEILSLFKLKNG
ncbi:hypothetical protein A3G67_01205 [Candidatus Roizmanbacteria bacterium RIFCSPLOWO2_12_FULL_40_12]|uniref:Uncharacterized protein n=1 Tax=Candidatus Roizmanbacteria bacterium RIFCSPLOWO2_01_FULL_40_42 TaxID=1802066 RepID=A0A1F7J541_9BACT|nr:MAG: hypothetical protein A2779_01680 [Candidatus Roizmanbacteria bacterium RIFCSPHIGHO2_01_FULL_40_98]OGK28522.1 MAG: hypothetical protein A3C31_01000 [Candidatus Roizmanbacteria bacterium RIFCSPHIGHO2_02_FULL_40_53]OGK50710.1 MAG: hypothetical protein A3B50_04390 [Candidatus Roizmanbacteria bacterium RIFCSPLOWO2_01_FULL_40_42]OGK61565.1 MAG: hypothetical protein A3G67_01205 [Candidatus Roizmanbacteria bacterium RIFCSPLOWO2_12_FULL_40_12]